MKIARDPYPNFPRQPKPVTVTLDGDPVDVVYWLRELSRIAEFKDDRTQVLDGKSFRIYPRAVND